LRDFTTGRSITRDADSDEPVDVSTVRPRYKKRLEEQKLRTKKKAEVFTPIKVVKQMNDYVMEKLMTSTYLEITCGEAPFITTRYDPVSGEPIVDRQGILDRKLKRCKGTFFALDTLKTVYGYEYQGDSLLIARVNVWRTMTEAVGERDELTEIICWNFFQMNGLTGKTHGQDVMIKDWSNQCIIEYSTIGQNKRL
jgi:type II restriction enzyme